MISPSSYINFFYLERRERGESEALAGGDPSGALTCARECAASPLHKPALYNVSAKARNGSLTVPLVIVIGSSSSSVLRHVCKTIPE